jgi:hypothetical protein
VELSRRAVSAERLFAIFGCLVAAFVVFAMLLEVSSFVTILAYRKFHHDPLAPQRSPAYDGEPWGREFWAEQTSFWSKARATYLPFMVWGVRNWHGKYINTDDTEMGSWRRPIPGMRDTCAKTAILRIWVWRINCLRNWHSGLGNHSIVLVART